ncbi:MAG: hypothetical protein ACI9BW_001901 [Gammaproteobacteria bacterium]|jgi:hypothetical protein
MSPSTANRPNTRHVQRYIRIPRRVQRENPQQQALDCARSERLVYNSHVSLRAALCKLFSMSEKSVSTSLQDRLANVPVVSELANQSIARTPWLPPDEISIKLCDSHAVYGRVMGDGVTEIYSAMESREGDSRAPSMSATSRRLRNPLVCGIFQ